MSVLEAKEHRVHLIEKLLPLNKVIICLKTNYPGEQKDNIYTQKLVDVFSEEVKKQFRIHREVYLNHGEGPVFIYVLDETDARGVKEKTIELEQHHPLGRCIDLDVYYQSIRSLSRHAFNIKNRKCFLCQDDAFVCMRNDVHTYEEITSYIKKEVENYVN